MNFLAEPTDIKHDLENATLAVQRLTKAIQPAWGRILGYIESHDLAVVSARELEILKESMLLLERESERVLTLLDQYHEEKVS